MQLARLGQPPPLSSGCRRSFREVRARGTLRVGSQQTFPPVEFREPGKTGSPAPRDLLAEIAKRLNLKLEYIQAEYAADPGNRGRPFRRRIGGISDTEEREEKLDFVNYMRSGGSISFAAP